MKTPLLMLSLSAPAIAAPGLTIYNDGLAVIRESVPLQLQAGETTARFDRATAQVLPDSVVLRDTTGNHDFAVLDQGYRNDPVSQGLLLDHFQGQTIGFREKLADGSIALHQGKIVRSGYTPGGGQQSPIIEVDGKLRFELPGQPVFPSLGDDSILRPTLSWTIGAEQAAEFDAQLSYLSRGFRWEATYNMVAPEKGDTMSMTGWVTLVNQSGTGFEQANLKLVAGDVNIIQPPAERYQAFAAETRDVRAKNQVEQKSFGDFHLYSLPRPLDLRDQETKQVEFVRSPGVETKRKYVYDPAAMLRFHGSRNDSPSVGVEFPKDVAIYQEFTNSEANGLGVPLPAGKIRFYREDSDDGNLEFVGENTIDHTPKDEELSVYTGNAFDLVGERSVTNFQSNDRENWMRETIEIELRNRSEEARTITVREHLWRWSNWEIEKPDAEFEKTDAQTIEFEIPLAAGEEKTLRYTAHYHW